MSSDSERALQFARSAPGIISALVGMSRPEHVLDNMNTAQHPLLDAEEFASFFARE